MPPIRLSALRGAIAITLFTAACGESAVEPTMAHSLPPAAAPPTILSTQSFSGRAADSVLNVLETTWARLGRGDERNARHAWRKRNGVPDSVRDSLIAPPQIGPTLNQNLLESGTSHPPPAILTHFEQLHWGYRDFNTNLPGSINAEMTFVGDNGVISLESLIMMGTKTGATFSTHGGIAKGPGEIVSCTDLLVGSCNNQHHLGGVMLLPTAPYCDARADGSLTYYANNLAIASGVTSFGTSISPPTINGTQGSASLDVGLAGDAPACQAQQTPPPVEQPAGPTETGGGSGAAPPPEPWDPAPPPPPPPPPGSGPPTFYCGRALYYQIINGEERFLAEVDVCYQV